VCLNHGVACLGTGVNPGFLMDFLPAVLTAVCGRVDQVRVLRFQDAAARRVPFQKKIGAGLTPDEFRAKASEGVLRHVGLVESMDFIAARLGWVLDRRSESLEPVIATEEIGTGYVPIRPGMARGVEQIGRGFIGSDEVITLHFRAAVGEPRSFDRIIIDGEPRLDATLDGGVNGDTATCAIVLNAIRSVASAPPGLRTMADVWPPSFYRPGRREIGGL
jgi:4-hydroxy-tetrahydrodipicolinate reductase